MLIQEKYDRMDWLTYGDEQRTEGEIRGAIKAYHRMKKLPTEIINLIEADFRLKHDEAVQYVEETLKLQSV